ncbi:MAG TPA: dihydroorotate dehydrogenase-like protein [Bryobacteraceae bacterium]|nr:dihydroorotate dehydrogenase-like protein [Bryobacteraceae bacterium]
MPDLSTTYLGLNLKNPVVVSPSPLCEEIGNIVQMEDAGAAAVVLHSLFEEQILIESQALDQGLSLGVESFAESLSYFPDMTAYNLGPEGYLEHIRKAKQAVNIPVIASLNGVTTGGWIKYARLMQEAGADALELNIFYLANDPAMSGAEVEELYTSLVSHVKASVRIPVAVKLGPYFSSMAHMAKKLDEAGADGLVLFNRFYQPDFDLENLEVVPALHLSTPHELLLRLHWVATLYGQVRADLAVTGGVHTAHDVLKAMMAGARVAMMTSALLRHGIDHIRTVLRDLVEWMEEHEYESVRQMQGSMSRRNVPDPSAFSRANYMKVLSSYAVKTPVR